MYTIDGFVADDKRLVMSLGAGDCTSLAVIPLFIIARLAKPEEAISPFRRREDRSNEAIWARQ